MKNSLFYRRISESLAEIIGNTPLVRINKLAGPGGADIYGKLEFFNLCSSIKDRICFAMIEAAEQEGTLTEGATIVEPTSGNTGIGLAFVCAVRGYKLVLTMPETMSVERRNILKSFGAELILTPGEKDMSGAVEKAAELAGEKGYYQPQQFKNPANPEVHRQTTAQEIIGQLKGIDAFVAGVGTGGTITGVGEVLKRESGGRATIVAVEPSRSPVLSGGQPGIHEIQGIGAGFVPDILNREVIDEIITVSDEEAYQTTRMLITQEGILCGVSSGANFFAARKVAERLGPGKTVVVVFPDTGERYLSTRLFEKTDLEE